jgi:hypothetical protein
MEKPRENLDFEKMKSSKDYGLRNSEVEQIPRLINNGLFAITVCLLGQDRSVDAARSLNFLGFPAVFIHGGFDKIGKLSEDEKKVLLNLLTKSPNLFIMLNKKEQEDQKDILAMIIKKEGKIAIVQNTEEILQKHLPPDRPFNIE